MRQELLARCAPTTNLPFLAPMYCVARQATVSPRILARPWRTRTRGKRGFPAIDSGAPKARGRAIPNTSRFRDEERTRRIGSLIAARFICEETRAQPHCEPSYAPDDGTPRETT